MLNETQDNNIFLSWAKKISIEHPDVLENMRKSTDPLDRVIAKRIMLIAGGCDYA